MCTRDIGGLFLEERSHASTHVSKIDNGSTIATDSHEPIDHANRRRLHGRSIEQRERASFPGSVGVRPARQRRCILRRGLRHFVDLDAAKGLVRIPQLSWLPFRDPYEIVREGEGVVVMVIQVDLERSQAWLSLKELQPDPLREFGRNQLGSVLTGRVTKVAPIGFFVAVGKGIEGLAPMSEHGLQGSPPVVDQEVVVRVDDVNLHHRRIRFGLIAMR
ncbi:S1 RNA-binding domain-containing protein [Nonomuraea endophytica]|uniref:S1 RNA-binding domain-containing protein n=1 Tax=Nonomuraea endophytica TaxID=714136 RepID=UPI0037CCA7B7